VKPPTSLVLVTLTASALGAGLAWCGLVLRLFPALPSPFGPWGWASGAGPRLVDDAQSLSWPMVAVGCAWLGVVLGLWMHLAWVRRVGLVLSALSALALGAALLLTVPAFVGLMTPSLARWLASDLSADGG
jgi:hypothetical protein